MVDEFFCTNSIQSVAIDIWAALQIKQINAAIRCSGREIHKELHVLFTPKLTTKAEPERPDWLLYDASSAAHYHTDPKLDQSCLAALGKFSTVLPIITQACQFVSRARRRILCILHCFTWWIVTYRRNLLSMKRCSEKGTSLMASKLSCHATFINHCFVTPRHALQWLGFNLRGLTKPVDFVYF